MACKYTLACAGCMWGAARVLVEARAVCCWVHVGYCMCPRLCAAGCMWGTARVLGCVLLGACGVLHVS